MFLVLMLQTHDTSMMRYNDGLIDWLIDWLADWFIDSFIHIQQLGIFFFFEM